MNALLAPHRRVIWVTWLIAALLFLPIGNGLIYGVTVPLTAGLLVLLAPGLLPSVDRHVDGRDIRAVLLLYVGVVTALYLAFQMFTVDRTLGLFLCFAAGPHLGCDRAGDLHRLDAASASRRPGLDNEELATSRWSWTHLGRGPVLPHALRLPAAGAHRLGATCSRCRSWSASSRRSSSEALSKPDSAPASALSQA